MKKIYIVKPDVSGEDNIAEIEKATKVILDKLIIYLGDEIEEVTPFLPEIDSALGKTIAKLKSMVFADYVVFVEGWGTDTLRACADECGLEILDVTNTKEEK